MANPLIPGVSAAEQDSLYQKLNVYNQKKASFKEAGAYLAVLPRPGHPRYSLWVYSPLPERQSIFYLFELSEDVHEALRMASTPVLLLPPPPIPGRIQRQADAEQRRRHHLLREVSRALPARNPPGRPRLSYLDSLQIYTTHTQAGTFRTDCQDIPFRISRYPATEGQTAVRRPFLGQGRG